MSRYSSISGISDKTLQKIFSDEAKNIEELDDWHDKSFLEKMKWLSWSQSIKRIHNPIETDDVNKNQ